MGVLFNYSGLSKSLEKLSKSVAKINGVQYNAKFILSVGSGNVVVNPLTGNYDLQTTSTVTITAQLIPDKQHTDNINIASPFTRIYLKGHLLEPLTYEGELSNYLECEILSNNKWLKGKFYPELNLSSSVVDSFNLSAALGAGISGYFEVNGNLPV